MRLSMESPAGRISISMAIHERSFQTLFAIYEIITKFPTRRHKYVAFVTHVNAGLILFTTSRVHGFAIYVKTLIKLNYLAVSLDT